MQKVDLSNLTLNQLSELTGCTYRTVKGRLKGLEPSKVDGKSYFYDPRAAIPLILEVAEKTGKDPAAAAAKFILQDEKARHSAALANKTELEVKKLQRELLPAQEVERDVTKMIMSFRAKILVMPSRLSAQLAGMKKPAECKRLLKDWAYETCEELSGYDARQSDSGPPDEDSEENGSAAEPEGERVGGPGEDPS